MAHHIIDVNVCDIFHSTDEAEIRNWKVEQLAQYNIRKLSITKPAYDELNDIEKYKYKLKYINVLKDISRQAIANGALIFDECQKVILSFENDFHDLIVSQNEIVSQHEMQAQEEEKQEEMQHISDMKAILTQEFKSDNAWIFRNMANKFVDYRGELGSLARDIVQKADAFDVEE